MLFTSNENLETPINPGSNLVGWLHFGEVSSSADDHNNIIVQVRTMNWRRSWAVGATKVWAHNKSHDRNSNRWSIPSLSVRHTWLRSNVNRTKNFIVEWPRWRLEFMSTLYHDNRSFSWYPVDVENSVRVRDSRLKNCDKKRTGKQTLRPGTSTGATVQSWMETTGRTILRTVYYPNPSTGTCTTVYWILHTKKELKKGTSTSTIALL